MSAEHDTDRRQEWNGEEDKFMRDSIKRTGSVDWRAVDANRVQVLPKLLARRGLVVPMADTSASELRVGEGSLWDESRLKQLGLIWHRLTPWRDTCHGLELLNKRFVTVALSNCYNDLLQELVAHSSIPFTHLYSSDMFESYKPNPKVYLGAAERMGVKPEECALVAAHLGDLKGAKACGFYAIYVERPLEEKSPDLHAEDIPDMVVGEDEGGLVNLARRLGISVE